MPKFLLGLMFLIPAMQAHASAYATLYQIDLIAFTHEQSTTEGPEKNAAPLMINNHRSIPLQADFTQTAKPYRLRSISTSLLKREAQVLEKQPNYQVLFHYTWLQPGNSQRPVKLPAMDYNGWHIDGTLRIRQSNYFLLDTDLYFTPNNNQTTPFVFSQNKRMKADTLYYLDHPQAGLLIKIHKLA